MLQIKIIPFNPFQVNCYVLYDQTGECIIIDASCYGQQEQAILKGFIQEQNLKPVLLVNTHCHIDHILGNNFVAENWSLKPLIHKDGMEFLTNAVEYGQTFGFEIDKPVMPEEFLTEGQILRFGNQELQVLETPGHAAGSVCLYHQKEKFVIAGDVLFHNSIGRTDLPTGNFETLVQSIQSKLFILPEETKVYCGHGPSTSIGEEKRSNPFLN
ncbi:MAG: MBL fold metallo-hydrolase [Bacteroidetes bacterium]|nr:MAG: MBL fold metallo-hydrolase [Bacteroidota bacterium]